MRTSHGTLDNRIIDSPLRITYNTEKDRENSDTHKCADQGRGKAKKTPLKVFFSSQSSRMA